MLPRDLGDLRLAQRSGGVERPGRKVRFARLMHRPGRVLGGPAVRAAYGGNLSLTLVATWDGGMWFGLLLFDAFP
jgi:hypothetical protein